MFDNIKEKLNSIFIPDLETMKEIQTLKEEITGLQADKVRLVRENMNLRLKVNSQQASLNLLTYHINKFYTNIGD